MFVSQSVEININNSQEIFEKIFLISITVKLYFKETRRKRDSDERSLKIVN